MNSSSSQQQQISSGEMQFYPALTEQQRRMHMQAAMIKFSEDLVKRIDDVAFKTSNGDPSVYQQKFRAYLQKAEESRNPQYFRQPMQNQQSFEQQQNSTQAIANNRTYTTQQMSTSNSTGSLQPNNSLQTASSISAMLNQPIRAPINQQTRLSSNAQTLGHIQSNIINSQNTSYTNPNIRLREPNPFQRGPANSTTNVQRIMSTVPITQTTDSKISLNNNTASSSTNNFSNLSLPMFQAGPSSTSSTQIRPKTTTAALTHFTASPVSAPYSNNNDTYAQNTIIHRPVQSEIASSSSGPTIISEMQSTSSSDKILQQFLSTNEINSAKATAIQRSLTHRPVASTTPTTILTTQSQPQPQSQSASKAAQSAAMSQMNTVPSLPGSMPSMNVRASIGTHQTNTARSNSNSLVSSNTRLPTSYSQESTEKRITNSSSGSLTQPTSVNNNRNSLPNSNQTNLTQNVPVSGNPSVQTANRPAANTGVIINPDEEVLSLVKYLRENANRLQIHIQRYITEGNLSRAREIQSFYQMVVQFVSNPTYELLPSARKFRQSFETSSRNQSNLQQRKINKSDLLQWDQAFGQFVHSDQSKRKLLLTFFIEPLNDVLNGVPHKKIRLDVDGETSKKKDLGQKSSSRSFESFVDQEINLLPSDIFSIEKLPIGQKSEIFDEKYNTGGCFLNCKLIDASQPSTPPLRLKISSNYPHEQPEILSLTKSQPPKLDFTDNHPFFEQISAYFLFYLFQSPNQYSITDILNIWRRSVQCAS